MMRDRFSLIAATTGGFMLAVALSGIVHATPITAQQNSSATFVLKTEIQSTNVSSQTQTKRHSLSEKS